MCNISGTKSQNLYVSRLFLQLSLPNPMKPGVKSRMKMWLEQRRQVMLQLHLSDRQFYCLLRWDLYQRLYGTQRLTLAYIYRNWHASKSRYNPSNWNTAEFNHFIDTRISCTKPYYHITSMYIRNWHYLPDLSLYSSKLGNGSLCNDVFAWQIRGK